MSQIALWDVHPTGSGPKRRDRGMASALSTFAHEQIRTAIVRASCSRSEFTSEQVLPLLPAGVLSQLRLHPNALGAAIHAAAREGLIEATGGVVRATRPEAHARKLTLWRLAPHRP